MFKGGDARKKINEFLAGRCQMSASPKIIQFKLDRLVDVDENIKISQKERKKKAESPWEQLRRKKEKMISEKLNQTAKIGSSCKAANERQEKLKEKHSRITQKKQREREREREINLN